MRPIANETKEDMKYINAPKEFGPWILHIYHIDDVLMPVNDIYFILEILTTGNMAIPYNVVHGYG